MLYESMQDAGLPISMTIEEYKKLKKEVKETYTDQIKLINQTKDNKTGEVATRLKEELIAKLWHPRNFEKFKYYDPEMYPEEE